MSELVEWIHDEAGPIALIVRAGCNPGKSTFFTSPDMDQQLGLVIHPKGAVIHPHDHHAEPRTLHSCPECLIVRRGRCEMTLFNRKRLQLSTHVLEPWDVVLILAGGHGFRMIEDCEIIETRAGTFPGDAGKVRF